ncbi:MAG TPA: hypothetical protein VHX38_37980 [Pseudonocardiaceae bacterium]|jgi:hypothetical protein|nr:hypothetical protein [Pseudonocardiaceae bacterium]
MQQRQPTLASSCARAATAAEARFRIDYPDTANRAARVIALDEQAAVIVRGLAWQPWRGGHFLVFDETVSAAANGEGAGGPAEAALRAADGTRVLLSDELAAADSVVMIATPAATAEAAEVIGDACAERMIMSAGLVVAADGDGGEPGTATTGGVVAALRPNAMVLVVLADAGDVPELLAALRV